MTPERLIAVAASRGVELWVEAGKLAYECPGPLPAELRNLITAHRAAMVAHLTAPKPNTPGGDPEYVVVASSDPAAVGGVWRGNTFHPPVSNPKGT